MFNEIEGMLSSAMGGGAAGPQAVGDAAEQHVSSMDGGELSDHLQTAADNARQTGDEGMAQQIEGMIARGQADPDALKSMAVDYIRNNPQVLRQFAPSFAQGILSKFGM